MKNDKKAILIGSAALAVSWPFTVAFYVPYASANCPTWLVHGLIAAIVIKAAVSIVALAASIAAVIDLS